MHYCLPDEVKEAIGKITQPVSHSTEYFTKWDELLSACPGDCYWSVTPGTNWPFFTIEVSVMATCSLLRIRGADEIRTELKTLRVKIQEAEHPLCEDQNLEGSLVQVLAVLEAAEKEKKRLDELLL